MTYSIKTLFNIFQTTRLWLLILRLGIFLALTSVVATSGLSLFWLSVPLFYAAFVLWATYEHLNYPLRFFVALMLDIAVISLILVMSDGVMSGWVSFLILPALIGCLSLARTYAWLVALFSVVCYGLLVWGSGDPEFVTLIEMSLNNGHLQDITHHGHDMAEMEQHMWGMWLTFSISITLMTGFLVQQRMEANAYQQSMLKMQEQFAREQQILAVASLTANTTHQLASPLSTAKMLLEELQEKTTDKSNSSSNLTLIEQELNRCSDILEKMVQQSTIADMEEDSQPFEFSPWLKHLLQSWWNGHNEIEMTTEGLESCDGLFINADQNLSFAFRNLLDNISKALLTDDDFRVAVTVDVIKNNTISIDIRYPGAPPANEVIEFLGKRIVKSKDGMGIGAILAQTSIERHNGSLEYFWQEDGYCDVSILLPVVECKKG